MTKLEVAAHEYAYKFHSWLKAALPTMAAVESFERGVEWRNANLWHDAQGDDLPPVGEKVIVLCDNGKVCFGHRPYEYVAGVSYDGKMTYMEAKTYGKGGWNIPEVKWWLDVELPNMEEQQ